MASTTNPPLHCSVTGDLLGARRDGPRSDGAGRMRLYFSYGSGRLAKSTDCPHMGVLGSGRLTEAGIETSVHPLGRLPGGIFFWPSLVQRPSSWCQGDWVGGSDKSPLLGQQRNVLGRLLGGYGSGGLTTASPNNKKPPLSRGLLIQQSSKFEKKLNLGVQPQPMAGACRATGVDSAAARSRGKL